MMCLLPVLVNDGYVSNLITNWSLASCRLMHPDRLDTLICLLKMVASLWGFCWLVINQSPITLAELCFILWVILQIWSGKALRSRKRDATVTLLPGGVCSYKGQVQLSRGSFNQYNTGLAQAPSSNLWKLHTTPGVPLRANTSPLSSTKSM